MVGQLHLKLFPAITKKLTQWHNWKKSSSSPRAGSVPDAIRQWRQRWWWLCSTVNGPKLDLSYFVRGVGLRHIVAQGAQLFSIGAFPKTKNIKTHDI
jgi:hypothetical protein